MKPINNDILINGQIANKLIQDLFSYLLYPHPNLQCYQLCCQVFINTTALSGTTFGYQLATAFCFLLASIDLSTVVFNTLSAIVSHFSSVLMALLAIMFTIRFFCLHLTISQNSSATLKICLIIQLASDYLDYLHCIKLIRCLTTLYKSAFKL